MSTEPSYNPDDARLRECMHLWAEALRARDLPALKDFYAEDTVFYDAPPPLFTTGLTAFEQNTEAWFSTWTSPIGLEIRDLHIHVSGDVAFSFYLYHLTGSRDGEPDTDVWMRATFGWRKRDGQWKIVHDHASVPFYMEPPFKAATDLKPDSLFLV